MVRVGVDAFEASFRVLGRPGAVSHPAMVNASHRANCAEELVVVCCVGLAIRQPEGGLVGVGEGASDEDRRPEEGGSKAAAALLCYIKRLARGQCERRRRILRAKIHHASWPLR